MIRYLQDPEKDLAGIVSNIIYLQIGFSVLTGF
ncbi:hypothetical protein MCETHM1_01564 [Flavobacteriaceae bacterium]